MESSGGGPVPLPFRASLGDLDAAVAHRLRSWGETGASSRIWRKEPAFWPNAPPSDVASRLGWLASPSPGEVFVRDLEEFAQEVRSEGTTDVAVLGMGGSSLAPQVYERTFPRRPGFPRLSVLDSTHPEAVRAFGRSVDPSKTVFVVSSKSGTTLEPNAFLAYFWDLLPPGDAARARRFVAITDPGTPLDQLGRQRGFRRVVRAPSDIGGRYSALTVFGLVPAALMGVDVRGLLGRAAAMAKGCGPAVAAPSHPALALAAVVGEATVAGHDKLVFVTSPTYSAFPAWGEQLVAESTGKQGRGIVPVADEVDVTDPMGSKDRTIIYLRGRRETDRTLEGGLSALSASGTPVVTLELGDPLDLGGEFFRWEMAIAAAGTIVGIDPFDQPDVELAKELARAVLRSPADPGSSAAGPAPVPAQDDSAVRSAFASWMGSVPERGYVAVQAYLPPSDPMTTSLQRLRGELRHRLRVSTTLGYGPRFLHSTGQLHKGGPPSGVFLQLVDRAEPTVPIPGMDLTFGRVIRAQAAGDAAALRQRGRAVLTIDLGGEGADAVDRLSGAVHG